MDISCKGDEGYLINIFINDYLSENVVNDGDVTLVIDPKIRMKTLQECLEVQLFIETM